MNFRKIIKSNKLIYSSLFPIVSILRKTRDSIFVLSQKNIFSYLSVSRIRMKRFEHYLVSISSNIKIKSYGNYELPKKLIIKEIKNILSFGIGTNIEFEIALIENGIKPNKINCFEIVWDQIYKSKLTEMGVNTYNYGLGIEDGTIKAFKPKDNTPNFTTNKVIANSKSWSEVLDVRIKSLNSILKMINNVEVIKADIEGGLPEILINLSQKKSLLPKVIIAEFELDRNFDEYKKIILILHKTMIDLGYLVHIIQRGEYRYFSLEILFFKDI